MPRRSASPSLLPLLRSQTQAGLLERLVLHPHGSYTVADLARSLGVTDQSVRRELHRMLDAGIVEREAVGRQGVYYASTSSPLYEPLRELVERSVGVEALLREILEQASGVEAAAIFGSWARGHIDAQSDVDLLVIGDIDYAALIENLVSLQERIGREVNVTWMRPGELRDRRDSGFVRDIMAAPMSVLVGHIEQD
jgi:predicted nucleotidyltransferase